MNLIIGATGMVGLEICRLLSASGKPVKAFVRTGSDPQKVEKLKNLGATIIRGDLRDNVSVKAACKGATTVIDTASSMPFAYKPGDNTPQTTDQDGALGLISAASEAGVKQMVYTSFPPMNVSFPLQDAKRAVEDRLRTSGLVYTILRPTFFTEVWLNPAVGFDYSNRKATIYGTGKNKISWISFQDVAQFAVASLDNSAARNAVLELGGPEGISPLKVVRIFEKVGSKSFEVTNVSVETLKSQYTAATDPMQKSFSGLMLGYASANAIDMKSLLKKIPLKLKTVEEYAKSVKM